MSLIHLLAEGADVVAPSGSGAFADIRALTVTAFGAAVTTALVVLVNNLLTRRRGRSDEEEHESQDGPASVAVRMIAERNETIASQAAEILRLRDLCWEHGVNPNPPRGAPDAST